MLPYRESRLTYIVLGFFFIVVIGYAYFEAQGILFGPQITVTSQPTEVDKPFILIRGKAERITSLSMNGKTIVVTENGDFEEPYLLAPGYNRIVLDAEDQYGRTRSKTLEIILSAPRQAAIEASAEIVPPTATTTGSASTPE